MAKSKSQVSWERRGGLEPTSTAQAAAAQAASVPSPAGAVEPPGALRRMFRFSQLGLAGGPEKGGEIAKLLAEELDDAGLPQELVKRVREGGGKMLASDLPKQWRALAGSVENSKALQDSWKMAQEAYRGFGKQNLKAAWDSALSTLAQSDPEIAKQLRTIPLETIKKVGLAPATSAVASQSKAPWFQSLWSKITKKAPTPRVSSALTSALESVGAGAATAEATAAIGGAATAGSVIGKVVKAIPKAGVAGFGLNLLAPMGASSPLGLPFRASRARDRAVEGFAKLGATSSSMALMELVKQQEMSQGRTRTLQTFEPEIFQQVLMALADTGQKASNLTDTERRIGASYEQQLPSRRPDKDVKFLLDQLTSEMSGGF